MTKFKIDQITLPNAVASTQQVLIQIRQGILAGLAKWQSEYKKWKWQWLPLPPLQAN
jgi:hypothetical protein